MQLDLTKGRDAISRFFPWPIFKVLIEARLDAVERTVAAFNPDVAWATPELRLAWYKKFFNQQVWSSLVNTLNNILFGDQGFYPYTFKEKVWDTTLTVPAWVLKDTTVRLKRPEIDYLMELNFLDDIENLLFIFYLPHVPAHQVLFPEFKGFADYLDAALPTNRTFTMKHRGDLAPYFDSIDGDILEDLTIVPGGATKADLGVFATQNLQIFIGALNRIYSNLDAEGFVKPDVVIISEELRLPASPELFQMEGLWFLLAQASVIVYGLTSQLAFYESKKLTVLHRYLYT